ncbi:Inner membrane protein YejM [Shewanella hafniensis]|nr:Inner membrane protein YejM [Shewanella hafniensis]
MIDHSLKLKLHTHGGIILFNSLIAMAIASRYFAFLPELPSDSLGIFFMLVSTFSQMALLAGILGLVTLPLLYFPKVLRQLLQSGTAALGISVLVIDTFVFAQYRFHINAVVLDLILAGQIVSFPWSTWVIVSVGVGLLWIGEWLFIRWLETAPLQQKLLNRYFLSLTITALLSTHVVHIWAAANAYQPVTQLKRYLPLFYPATANSLMRKYGYINEPAIAQQKALTLKSKSDLRYPIEQLSFAEVSKPTNILLIVIDSWRADTFNADNTPNLWEIAQSGVIFNQHIASGNSTRAGIFGLFYGIPGTYWHAILANQQSPLIIDRLQQLNYQMGIFTAAQLHQPEFDQTVFANIDNLRIGSSGASPSALDANLVKDWTAWYAQRDKQRPVFSFLFFDSPHGYDFPSDYPHRYEPMLSEINYLQLNNNSDPVPFFNRYKTSVHYVDSLAKQVLETLKSSGELDNTLVIITGDHAQEINDNKLNFWGHNSNYTDAQVKVPFAIVGPKVNVEMISKSNNKLTSHQDVVPTLMENYLGVKSPINHYSVGKNLLNQIMERPWIISTDYNGFAIITDESILEVGASGQYALLDKTNRPLKDQQPNFDYLQQALEQLSRFNK